MPIDWSTVAEPEVVGRELHALMRELFPIPRSLTGDGVRATLGDPGRDIPLEVVELPTGTQVFDWTLPREWNVREAWVEGPDGTRVIDVADSPLHLLGYSTPVDDDARSRRASRAPLHRSARPRRRALPHLVLVGAMGVLHHAARGRRAPAGRVPRA